MAFVARGPVVASGPCRAFVAVIAGSLWTTSPPVADKCIRHRDLVAPNGLAGLLMARGIAPWAAVAWAIRAWAIRARRVLTRGLVTLEIGARRSLLLASRLGGTATIAIAPAIARPSLASSAVATGLGSRFVPRGGVGARRSVSTSARALIAFGPRLGAPRARPRRLVAGARGQGCVSRGREHQVIVR